MPHCRHGLAAWMLLVVPNHLKHCIFLQLDQMLSAKKASGMSFFLLQA